MFVVLLYVLIVSNISCNEVTKLLCYCIIKMLHSIHSEEEAPIGEDFD